MHFLKHAIAALSLGLVAATVGATPTDPQSGVEYRTLEQAQPTESGNKVEVTEFFWYSCPHCFAFEPALEAWVKKQGDRIDFKRVPVMFRPSMVPEQKMYYALEAMGKVDALHKKVFDAIHLQHERLDNETAIVNFMAQHGIDKQRFLDVYNSFSVASKVRRAAQLEEAYQVDGVPLLAFGGRYETSPSIVGTSVGSHSESALLASTLQVMDALVAKVEQQQKKQPGAKAKAR